MSAHKICEAYGWHQAYCPMDGYPIEMETAADIERVAKRDVLTALRAALLARDDVSWAENDVTFQEIDAALCRAATPEAGVPVEPS